MEKVSNVRKTDDGMIISASQVRRLEREVKADKEQYDSLRIKMLTMAGVENDPAKKKREETDLENFKKKIRTKEQQIIEIKLALK